MKFYQLLLAGIIVLGIGSGPAHAQFYGENLVEFQYGNLPYTDNPDLTTSYDQLDLYYDSSPVHLHARVEHFLTPNRDRNYLMLTQKQFEYDGEHIRVRLGNFYETIGRGLLLRSYAIPGSIYEDRFYRTRYAFYRDLEGISVGYSGEWVRATVLRARPLFNIVPPNFTPDSARRPDLAEAVEFSFVRLDNVTIGGAFMRNHPDNKRGYAEYGSFKTNINLPLNLQLYSEYAFSTKTKMLKFRDEEAYGWYTGLNFYQGSFGMSLEYKNYNNFNIGSGSINNPPSLIKEHTYPVLNRSTHVLNLSNESGVQAELFYHFDKGHSLVLNVTRAKNDLVKDFEYEEYFLEGTYQVDRNLSVKGFIDYAEDGLKSEEHRWSFGLITEETIQMQWNLSLDLQYQQFDRPFLEDKVKNYYGSLSFGSIPDLTVSAVFEASTDPSVVDNPDTFEQETDTRIWLGGNIRYQFNSNNTLILFAGKRRGGPACTSGICYDRLDFEGVEIRLNTRF